MCCAFVLVLFLFLRWFASNVVVVVGLPVVLGVDSIDSPLSDKIGFEVQTVPDTAPSASDEFHAPYMHKIVASARRVLASI